MRRAKKCARKLPGETQAYGDCYGWGLKRVRQGGVLVHGTVQDPWSKQRHPHAWVEDKGFVSDYQQAVMGRQPVPTAQWYAWYQPQDTEKYSSLAASKMALRTKHAGPWGDGKLGALSASRESVEQQLFATPVGINTFYVRPEPWHTLMTSGRFSWDAKGVIFYYYGAGKVREAHATWEDVDAVAQGGKYFTPEGASEYVHALRPLPQWQKNAWNTLGRFVNVLDALHYTAAHEVLPNYHAYFIVVPEGARGGREILPEARGEAQDVMTILVEKERGHHLWANWRRGTPEIFTNAGPMPEKLTSEQVQRVSVALDYVLEGKGTHPEFLKGLGVSETQVNPIEAMKEAAETWFESQKGALESKLVDVAADHAAWVKNKNKPHHVPGAKVAIPRVAPKPPTPEEYAQAFWENRASELNAFDGTWQVAVFSPFRGKRVGIPLSLAEGNAFQQRARELVLPMLIGAQDIDYRPTEVIPEDYYMAGLGQLGAMPPRKLKLGEYVTVELRRDSYGAGTVADFTLDERVLDDLPLPVPKWMQGNDWSKRLQVHFPDDGGVQGEATHGHRLRFDAGDTGPNRRTHWDVDFWGRDSQYAPPTWNTEHDWREVASWPSDTFNEFLSTFRAYFTTGQAKLERAAKGTKRLGAPVKYPAPVPGHYSPMEDMSEVALPVPFTVTLYPEAQVASFEGRSVLDEVVVFQLDRATMQQRIEQNEKFTTTYNTDLIRVTDKNEYAVPWVRVSDKDRFSQKSYWSTGGQRQLKHSGWYIRFEDLVKLLAALSGARAAAGINTVIDFPLQLKTLRWKGYGYGASNIEENLQLVDALRTELHWHKLVNGVPTFELKLLGGRARPKRVKYFVPLHVLHEGGRLAEDEDDKGGGTAVPWSKIPVSSAAYVGGSEWGRTVAARLTKMRNERLLELDLRRSDAIIIPRDELDRALVAFDRLQERRPLAGVGDLQTMEPGKRLVLKDVPTYHGWTTNVSWGKATVTLTIAEESTWQWKGKERIPGTEKKKPYVQFSVDTGRKVHVEGSREPMEVRQELRNPGTFRTDFRIFSMQHHKHFLLHFSDQDREAILVWLDSFENLA